MISFVTLEPFSLFFTVFEALVRSPIFHQRPTTLVVLITQRTTKFMRRLMEPDSVLLQYFERQHPALRITASNAAVRVVQKAFLTRVRDTEVCGNK